MSQQKGGNNGNGSHLQNGAGKGVKQSKKQWSQPWSGHSRETARVGEPRTTGYIDECEMSRMWGEFTMGKVDKVFKGGSAVEFSYWAQGFQMKAISEGVWSMFEPPDGTIKAITEALHGSRVLSASSAIGIIVEDTFTAERPSEVTDTAVRRKMDEKLFVLHDQMDTRLYDVDYGPGTEEERKLMAAAVYRDWADKRFIIEGSADAIRSQMISQIEQYDKAQKRYEDKTSKCFKVFTECLGDGPLALIKPDLLACRFRSAYLTLHLNYNSSIGGAQSSVDLNALISGVKWNPGIMSALEFIEKMEVLLAMYESQGNTMRPQTHDAMIFGALGRAGAPEFKDDIEEAQKKGKTLQWLVDRLSRTGAQESMKKLLKGGKPVIKKRARSTTHVDWGEDEEFAGMSRVVTKARTTHCDDPRNCETCMYAEVPTCTKCQKRGHKLADCWLGMECAKCGKTGHPTNRCLGEKPTGGGFKSPNKKIKNDKPAKAVAFKVGV